MHVPTATSTVLLVFTLFWLNRLNALESYIWHVCFRNIKTGIGIPAASNRIKIFKCMFQQQLRQYYSSLLYSDWTVWMHFKSCRCHACFRNLRSITKIRCGIKQNKTIKVHVPTATSTVLLVFTLFYSELFDYLQIIQLSCLF